MRIRCACVCFLILCFNCSSHENKTIIEAVLEFHSEDYSFNKSDKYVLETNKNDSLVKYIYVHKSDSLKNISATYDLNNKTIWLPFAQFHRIDDKSFTIISISSSPFYYFDNKDHSASHVTEPLIFNKDYGLLAIGNTYGANFIFLKKEKDSIYRKEIGEKLKMFYN